MTYVKEGLLGLALSALLCVAAMPAVQAGPKSPAPVTLAPGALKAAEIAKAAVATEKMATPAEKKPAKPHATHWGYEGDRGPDRWSTLEAGFEACASGRQQSPLNIENADAAGLAPLVFHYAVSPIDLVNNGHTVQANYGAGSHITVGDERFDLLQFHFHTPSEHRVAGQAFPMEIHFVHRHASGRLAVVGVFVALGAENLAAREVWDRLPREPHSTAKDSRAIINARDLLPPGTAYFRYAGSLTTPPCSEQVDWFVLQQPVAFSAEQISQLHAVIGRNARPVQARHGRYLLQATGG